MLFRVLLVVLGTLVGGAAPADESVVTCRNLALSGEAVYRLIHPIDERTDA
jgi:hypothetical protein